MSLRLPNGSRLLECTLIAVIACILAALYIEPRQTVVHEIRFSPSCPNNLKFLSLALHEYHQLHGSFPPPFPVDSQGRPAHSWRVLILPMLGEADLYKAYKFDEPWNGPHNSQLATRMPTVFGCPDQHKWEFPHGERRWTTLSTNYVALVGTHAAFRAVQARRMADFGGNTGNKLMVIEIADSGINWMEPRDYDVETEPFDVAELVHKKLSLSHGQSGVHGINVDGSIRFLSTSTRPDHITHLIDIDRK